MKEVIISIIIPVYQAEHFIERTIQSVLNQTFKDFELILINDGSKDKSGEICNKFATIDERIKVIHQKNAGQSAARNIGINVARGKYVGFMDHDDILHPEMYRHLYENAKKYKADISAVSYITQGENGKLRGKNYTENTFIYNNKEGMAAFLSRIILDIYVWTKLYLKKFILNNNLQFESGRSDEDFLFNYSAFSVAQKTVMRDTPLYIYNDHPNSTCNTFWQKEPKKYLNDTWYRLMKIENGVKKKYPDLYPLAQLQTIKYCFRMLFVISKFNRNISEPYYSQIKQYFRKNAMFIIKHRKYWSMTFPGVILATYLPETPYFHLKQWKHRND